MGREWLSAVAMAVAVLREMARLARGDDGQIKTAVESLVVSLRSGPYALLQVLCTGEVYRWEGRRGAERIGDYR